MFMCFFSGHSLWGGEKHINKIPPKSRDNPVKILFTCCFLYVFFFLSETTSADTLGRSTGKNQYC